MSPIVPQGMIDSVSLQTRRDGVASWKSEYSRLADESREGLIYR